MNASIGTLNIELAADLSKFLREIERAQRSAAGAMSEIAGSARTATTHLDAMAGAMAKIRQVFAVAGVAGFAKQLVEMAGGVISAASALDDLAESTGSSVSTLSQLTNQAKVAGVSSETLYTAINKLAAGMNGVDDESTKIGKALAQVGIEAKDPAAAFREIALTMDKYSDGTGKAAFMADVFGKNWAAVMPALRAVVEEQDVQATVTAKQAAEAEALEKNWRRLSVEANGLKDVLLNNLVPALSNLLEQFSKGTQIAGGFWSAMFNFGTLPTASNPVEALNIIDDIKAKIAELKKTQDAYRNSDREGLAAQLTGKMTDLQKKLQYMTEVVLPQLQRATKGAETEFGAYDEAIAKAAKSSLNYTSNAKETKKGVDEFAKALESAEKAQATANLALEDFGVAADQKATPAMRTLQTLMASDVWKTFNATQQQTIKGKFESADATERYVAGLKQETEWATKSIEAEEKRNEELGKETQKRVDALLAYQDGNKNLEREIELIGGTATQRELLAEAIRYETELKKLEAAQDEVGIEFLKKEYEERKRLIELKGAKTAEVEAATEFKRQWSSVISDVTNSLSNFLVDLANNGSSAFKNLWSNFKNWALKALADIAAKQIVVSVLGAVGLTGAGTAAANGISGAGGGGSLLGSAGSALGLSNPYGQGFSLTQNTWGAGAGFGGSAGAGFSAIAGGAGIGALVGYGTSAMFGNGYNNNNMQLAATIGGAIGGAVAGPVGAIVGSLLGSAIGSLDSTGKPQDRYGTWMSSTADKLPRGNTLFQSSSAFGAMGIVDDRWFSDADMGASVQAFLSGIQQVDNAIANAVGPEVTEQIKTNLANVTTEFNAGLEHGAVGFGDIARERYAVVLNTVESGLGDLVTAFVGTDEAVGTFSASLVTAHQMLQTFDVAAVFGEVISEADLAKLAGAGGDVSGTLSNLINVFSLTNSAARTTTSGLAAGSGAFGSVGLASTAAREQLIKFAGGADKMAAGLSSYYANFYTAAERSQMSVDGLTQAFDAQGLTLPTTIEGYRELVAAQDLSTESGRQAWGFLMQMNGAWVEAAAAGDLGAQAAESLAAAQRSSADIANERAGLEQRLLQLQGNTAELRRLELEKLDPSNRALQQRIWLLEDEQRIAQEREGLETRLYELTGNTVALRERELAKLDPSNRALQQQIWALEDARSAQDAYNAAVSAASSAYEAAAQAVSSAQSAVDAIRARGTDAVVSAEERVAAAQKALADAQVASARKMLEIATTLRDFVDKAYASPSSKFGALLTKALGGDATAMAALPEAATAAITSARDAARTSAEAAIAQARIMADVSRVADIAAAAAGNVPPAEDPIVTAQNALAAAVVDLNEAIRVANEIQAPLTKQQSDLIGEYNKALAALEKALADQEAARIALNSIAIATAATVTAVEALQMQFEDFKLTGDATINFILGSTLPDELKDLAISTERSIIATVDFAIGADLPNDIKQMVLTNAKTLDRTLNIVVGADVSDDIKRVAFDSIGKYTTTIETVLGSSVSNGIKRLVLDGAGTYNATIQASLAPGLSDEARHILVDQAGQYTVNIGAIVNSSLSDAEKTLLLNANTTATRAVTIATSLDNIPEAERTVLLESAQTAQRIINLAAESGSLSEKDWAAIEMVDETVSKTIQTLLDDSSLSQSDKDLIAAVSGSTAGTVTIDGGVTWNPDADTYSIFVAIKESTAWLGEIHGFLSVIHTDIGAWPAEIHGYLGLIYDRLGSAPQFSFDRTPYQSGVWAKGGAFANSIVASPTMTNVGLMGEAGPEAIMPLTRGPDGSLGVRALGGFAGDETNAELLAELRTLRAELEGLRAESRATAVATTKSTRILQRVTQDGEAMQTVSAA